MRKSYQIEVDCANCANRIEQAAGKIEGVKEVSVNFLAQKISVEFAEGADVKRVMEEIDRAGRKIDRDFCVYL